MENGIKFRDRFVGTWQINNRVNLMLLDGISDEGLNVTLSSRGGGTPAKQFAHMNNVRIWQIEKVAPELKNGLTKLSLKDRQDREELKMRLIESSEAIEKVLQEAYEKDGEMKGFRRGVTAFQGYLISHESHHRGNIMLTLKQCGYKLPKSLTYGIWDWNKI